MIHQAEKDASDGIPPDMAVNAIKVPSTASPHATWDKSPWGLADRPWLESMFRKYGRKSLWVKSHIDAEIPIVSADILIRIVDFDFACSYKRRPTSPNHPIHSTRRLSCDLGEGVGRDSTCVLVRDDWGVLEVEYGNALGLPEAAALMMRLGKKWSIPAERMSFDKLGIGRNFPNQLVRYGLEKARPYVGESSPRDRHGFTNLRTESAWKLRNRLDQQHVPDIRAPHTMQEPFSFCPGAYQARLRDEIKPLTYELYGSAVKLLPKDEWCDLLGHSPDVCDTLIQSFSW